MRLYRPLDIVLIVLFLAIITAIVIVNLPEGKKPCCCGVAAISALRTMGSAQELYKTRHGTYATLGQLAAANLFDFDLDRTMTSTWQKNGYCFTFGLNNAAGWSCVARPADWDMLERNFLINTDGLIYYNAEQDSTEFTKVVGKD